MCMMRFMSISDGLWRPPETIRWSGLESARGTIALAKVAKAYAYLEGRTFCIPQDVAKVFPDVAVHRLFLSARARAARMESSQVIEEILAMITQPKAGKGRRE